jgi:uncharacterized membrane protein YhaH (DUF805 family)
MQSPFAFEGTLRRLPYALWSIGIFFGQYVVVLVAAGDRARDKDFDLWTALAPLRSLVTHYVTPDIALLLALGYLLLAAWALAALSFRRASDADINETIAVLAIVPIIQIAVILVLCVAPSRTAPEGAPTVAAGSAAEPAWTAVALGLVVGIGLTLAAVAVGALVFGTYGFGMFMVTPILIGAVTGYVANRKTDLGGSRTAALVATATALGGAALVIVALEGIVCIVMAAPLAFGVALAGGALGRGIALSTKRSPAQTLSGFAVLPLIFALESVFPSAANFETYQTITVRAPPEAVWRSIAHMEPIDEAPALQFRLGVAYPVSGEFLGEGVGAMRRGVFSTGTAIEQVTEWIPNRKLAFVVLTDVPAMRELSPYEHVHAPHVVGYFNSKVTSFELVPRSDGGTDVIERTSHELKLEPVLYWLPLARWVVSQNNARVLAHIRRQAERSVQAAH